MTSAVKVGMVFSYDWAAYALYLNGYSTLEQMRMSGELENQIRETVKDQPTAEKLVENVDAAAKEFPCLTCGSRDECATYQWFMKWFGEKQ